MVAAQHVSQASCSRGAGCSLLAVTTETVLTVQWLFNQKGRQSLLHASDAAYAGFHLAEIQCPVALLVDDVTLFEQSAFVLANAACCE